MTPEILTPWILGHGLLLAVIIGRRVFRNVTGI